MGIALLIMRLDVILARKVRWLDYILWLPSFPLMEGGSRNEVDEAELAWSYAPSSNYGSSVRDNRYKFIFRHGAWETVRPPEEFYDLREDPQRNRVKALRIGQGSAQLEGATMTFEVPAGEVFLVAFEGQIASPLRLKIESDSEDLFSGQIDPDGLETVWSVRFDPKHRQIATLDAIEGDGAFIWWNRRSEEEAIQSPKIDEELKKQLEALGYVD